MRTSIRAKVATVMMVALTVTAVAAAAEELWRQDPAGSFSGPSSQDARNDNGLGWFSEVADNFDATGEWVINTIRFWGGYARPPGGEGNTRGFTVRFYDDHNAYPGTLLFEEDVMDFTESLYYVDATWGYGGYEYNITLNTPFDVPADGRYWISIVAILDRGGSADEPQWGWNKASDVNLPYSHQWWFDPGNFVESVNKQDVAFILFGSASSSWIGNTFHQSDAGDNVWISCETWPAGTATIVEVVYSIDGGASWSLAALSSDGAKGNNDGWHGNLGTFPPGTTIRYAVVANDAYGSEFWDNNGGDDYLATIEFYNGDPVYWIGNTHYRPDAEDNVWINCETWPAGAARTVEVVFSIDGGASWSVAALQSDGPKGNNDGWHGNLGTLPPGTTIRYAVVANDAYGNKFWDNNGGVDYLATVKRNGDPVYWVGNTYHWAVDGAIDSNDKLWIHTESWPAGAAVEANVVYSTDGGTTWQIAPMNFDGQIGANDGWTANLGAFPAGTVVQYALWVVDGWEETDQWNNEHWDNNHGTNYIATVNGEPVIGQSPENDIITSGDDLLITFDAAGDYLDYTLVEVDYSLNGVDWTKVPMELTPKVGYDHWEVNLGQFAPGSFIQYVLIATDGAGNRRWFKNGGEEYFAWVHSDYSNLVPSVSGPSSSISSSGTYSPDYEAWHAIDGDPLTVWMSGIGVAPAWIAYTFDAPTLIDRYTIDYSSDSITTQAPGDFELQGSNGVNWVTLDARTNETDWSVLERRSFMVSNPGAYTSYRLLVTDDNDERAGIEVISLGELALESGGFDEYYRYEPIPNSYFDVWFTLDVTAQYESVTLVAKYEGTSGWFDYVQEMTLVRSGQFDRWEYYLNGFGAWTQRMEYKLLAIDAAGNQHWFTNEGGTDYVLAYEHLTQP